LFFGVSSATRELDDGEKKIRGSLYKECLALIEKRNEVVHGVWLLASKTGDESVRWDEPFLAYVRLSYREGMARRDTKFTFKDLIRRRDFMTYCGSSPLAARGSVSPCHASQIGLRLGTAK